MAPLSCFLFLASVFLEFQRPAPSPGRVEILQSIGGLSPAIVGQFRDPIGFERAADGRSFVFDRRGHSVYRIDADGVFNRKIVAIGGEEGRVIEPSAFDVADDGSFIVADAPNGRERIQAFNANGTRMSGFLLPGRAAPRVVLGTLSLSGVGTIAYTGSTIVMSQPESGWLMTEYGLTGFPLKSVGHLRPTRHENDRALHVALNAGIALPAPGGGFYFVFMAGPPAFRKYDAEGQLLFERAIQGREIDPIVAAIPDRWPRRAVDGTEIPLVAPTVRTAAVDPGGRLWVSFVVPFTYVYDREGEKTRTVQFRAGAIIAPSSLSFPGQHLLVTPGCYEFAPE
ncbi:MAG: hypothetical protein ACRD2N_18050 [Vicinamibacterales bacterium]